MRRSQRDSDAASDSGSRSARPPALGAIIFSVGVVIALGLIGILALTGVSHTRATNHRPPAVTSPPEPEFSKERVTIRLIGAKRQPLMLVRALQRSSHGTIKVIGNLVRAPCPKQHYVFRARIESLVNTLAIEYAAYGTIDSAHIPPGIRCGALLPIGIGRDMALTITGSVPPNVSSTPLTLRVERKPSGTFTGLATIANEFCPSEYGLTAVFNPPGRHADFRYTLRITRTTANGVPDGSCPRSS